MNSEVSTAQAAELVRVQGLNITFGGVDVVSNVDFELRPGEIHAVTGENGAGKSSLAKAIAGVYRPRSGLIRLNGRQVWFKNPRAALASGIALIHQEPTTFPDLDVADNIFAGNYLRQGPFSDRSACLRRAKELLESLGSDLDPRAHVDQLSVAQRQYIELASALAHDAKVWIFDETTASLSPKEVEELFAVMRKLRDRGCALMMVSHHLHEVFEISDRITVLRDGAKVAELETEKSDPKSVVRLMVGRELDEEAFEAGKPGTPCLTVRNLSGAGFSNVSLDVRRGEIVGIAGLVGAGRTELARAIFGIAQPDSGSIEIDGTVTAIPSPRQAMEKGMALVPEDRIFEALFMDQSVGFNATAANLGEHSAIGLVSRKRIEATVDSFAKKLNLKFQGPNQSISQLSGGNQQKVVLSRWLATEPKLLILDEPTRGVDVGAKRDVHQIIRDLANEGLAVLMISSDLKEILTLSDRIAVMREGQIVKTFERGEATEESIMLFATGEALVG